MMLKYITVTHATKWEGKGESEPGIYEPNPPFHTTSVSKLSFVVLIKFFSAYKINNLKRMEERKTACHAAAKFRGNFFLINHLKIHFKFHFSKNVMNIHFIINLHRFHKWALAFYHKFQLLGALTQIVPIFFLF